MRILFLLILFLSFFALKAQPVADFESVYKELRKQFKNSIRRGGSYNAIFTLSSNDHIQYTDSLMGRGGDAEINSLISPALLRFKNHFIYAQEYSLSIWFDKFSDTIYPEIMLTNRGPSKLINAIWAVPMPVGGIEALRKQLDADIRRNIHAVDQKDIQSGKFILKILVKKDRTVLFIQDSSTINLLDSVKLMKWKMGIINGVPRDGLVTINIYPWQLVAHRLAKGGLISIAMDSKIILPTPFMGEYVQFSYEEPRPTENKVLVSLVWNSLTNTFENPIIHKGTTLLGRSLIEFILNNRKDVNGACYHRSRYFFYL